MVPEQAPIGGWLLNKAEMISHTPLAANVAAVQWLSEHCKTDNKTVWTKLVKMRRDHDCWTFIHQHQKAKNGWLEFWSLYDHYLGTHNVDTLCAHAENKLTTMEKRSSLIGSAICMFTWSSMRCSKG
jgi:oligoribonuclease NrnB/cAMP/cGMP phosphodiesterase (DHH superfamily)